MFRIHYLNPISPKGSRLFTEAYRVTEQPMDAHGIMVRSADMQAMELPTGLLAVSRAGAGVNNIPLSRCAENGTVVFNTPGANANGVVELALCGLLLGSRDIVGGISWVKSICKEADVQKKVEKGKSQFAGYEIAGKKLGVIGLGAIGGPLANKAIKLGMQVYGYDPYISIDAAWHLDSAIVPVKAMEDIFASCDYISLHTPLLDSTRGMIGADAFSKMKKGVVLLNFARDALVDDSALEQALKMGTVRRYITDFPNDKTAGMDGVIAIPHLGASTEESEDNCAAMAVRQMMNYLENGNIVHSVNFPDCDMGRCTKAARMLILHKNIPNSLGRFTSAVAGENINISDLLNRSKGEYACTMLDLDSAVTENLRKTIEQIEGVFRVRVIL